ncbi:MAG TPA: glutathione S-transferase family protein [Candidatus Polarisedimenticolaceae bacterium]|nr:glutathione S-transferase family protein [Candidatus Polarisedimenticolaceae bacterium]
MTTDLTIHGFETSNNIKVRVALGYKRIPYAFRAIDPADRSEILRLSGQRLTPVMQHGDVVLFDSAAILRYLEANFRDRPPLFGASRDEQWAIEDLELFARHTLAGPMMDVVHRRVASGSVDAELQSRCQARFAAEVGRLVAALGEREWLVGDRMSAADVTAAPVIRRVRSAGLFELPPAAERLAPWVERVMAYDGQR